MGWIILGALATLFVASILAATTIRVRQRQPGEGLIHFTIILPGGRTVVWPPRDQARK